MKILCNFIGKQLFMSFLEIRINPEKSLLPVAITLRASFTCYRKMTFHVPGACSQSDCSYELLRSRTSVICPSLFASISITQVIVPFILEKAILRSRDNERSSLTNLDSIIPVGTLVVTIAVLPWLPIILPSYKDCITVKFGLS